MPPPVRASAVTMAVITAATASVMVYTVSSIVRGRAQLFGRRSRCFATSDGRPLSNFY